MKIGVDSNRIRQQLAEKLSEGASDDFTLAYDQQRREMVCVKSEDDEGPFLVPLLYLEELELPGGGFTGQFFAAYLWLTRKFVWADIAHTMEDNAYAGDLWLQWRDAEHYAIGGDALARPL